MSMRSRALQPKDWAGKAPTYIKEAKELGINIYGPNILGSDTDFTVKNNEVHFGFNAIRHVGEKAARAILEARGNQPFTDIWDFIERIDHRIINLRAFEYLVKAGCFDLLGYKRQDLLENAQALYDYYPNYEIYLQRIQDIVVRDEHNQNVEKLKEQEDLLLKQAKEENKKAKKANLPLDEEWEYILNKPERLKDYRKRVKEFLALEPENPEDLSQVLSFDEYNEYTESLKLRRLPALKPIDKPIKPQINQYKDLTLSVDELTEQAIAIGCYLGTHPASIVYPYVTKISDLEQGDYTIIGAAILETKEIKTRKGDTMLKLKCGDGTGIIELVIFPNTYKDLTLTNSLPKANDLAQIEIQVQEIEPVIQGIVKQIEIYRSN